MDSPISGVVLLDKGEGESSFSALGQLKRTFNTKRVGHTGTLDPMATGLMVALIGPATRCARFFSSLDKSYIAEISFGTETDSADRTGSVTRSADVPAMADAASAAHDFLGEISQVPPVYSAVHIDGRRAYERARAGEEVVMPSRQVTIHDVKTEIVNSNTLRLAVRCSTGTYIRSLARDLGRALGSAAHLSALRRTTVGPFSVDEIAASGQSAHLTLDLGASLLRLGGFTEYGVDSDTAGRMYNGGRVAKPAECDKCESWVLASLDGQPVSVGRWDDSLFRYEIVFPRPEQGRD